MYEIIHRNENRSLLIYFLELSDAAKFNFQQQDTQLHITREGNSIREKSIVGTKVVFEPILILNEVTEFKDNPDNPIVYVKVCTYTVWFTKIGSLLPLAKKSLS